jgi:hypothetical protein
MLKTGPGRCLVRHPPSSVSLARIYALAGDGFIRPAAPGNLIFRDVRLQGILSALINDITQLFIPLRQCQPFSLRFINRILTHTALISNQQIREGAMVRRFQPTKSNLINKILELELSAVESYVDQEHGSFKTLKETLTEELPHIYVCEAYDLLMGKSVLSKLSISLMSQHWLLADALKQIDEMKNDRLTSF